MLRNINVPNFFGGKDLFIKLYQIPNRLERVIVLVPIYFYLMYQHILDSNLNEMLTHFICPSNRNNANYHKYRSNSQPPLKYSTNHI